MIISYSLACSMHHKSKTCPFYSQASLFGSFFSAARSCFPRLTGNVQRCKIELRHLSQLVFLLTLFFSGGWAPPKQLEEQPRVYENQADSSQCILKWFKVNICWSRWNCSLAFFKVMEWQSKPFVLMPGLGSLQCMWPVNLQWKSSVAQNLHNPITIPHGEASNQTSKNSIRSSVASAKRYRVITGIVVSSPSSNDPSFRKPPSTHKRRMPSRLYDKANVGPRSLFFHH